MCNQRPQLKYCFMGAYSGTFRSIESIEFGDQSHYKVLPFLFIYADLLNPSPSVHVSAFLCLLRVALLTVRDTNRV